MTFSTGIYGVNSISISICHLLLFSLFLKILESQGLRDVRLEGFSHVRRGEDINLRCNYDLELGTLYAVKWYRNGEEFYRFIPKERNPKQTFAGPGILVDNYQSDDHQVLLRNASFETSGKFKCSVSVEGSFQTLSDTKEVTVVVIGYDAPTLVLRDLHYEAGSQGEATCRMHRTFPPVNVTWFFNDQVVTERIITRIGPDEREPSLSTVISIIYFKLPADYYGPTIIKCRMQLYDLYLDASMTKIQPRVPSNYVRKAEMPDSLSEHWRPHPTLLLIGSCFSFFLLVLLKLH